MDLVFTRLISLGNPGEGSIRYWLAVGAKRYQAREMTREELIQFNGLFGALAGFPMLGLLLPLIALPPHAVGAVLFTLASGFAGVAVLWLMRSLSFRWSRNVKLPPEGWRTGRRSEVMAYFAGGLLGALYLASL